MLRTNRAADNPKRGGAEGVKGAIGKPPCRLRRGEIPATKKTSNERKPSPMLVGRAHLARQCYVDGKSSLGARLRTREVTGRDASLPAPLLSAFRILVARGTIGALPQTPQGTLSLDPARGNFPLDPFRAIELVAFPILLPRVYSSFAACSMFFLAAESISFTRLS